MEKTVQELNEHFAIPNQLFFESGPNDTVMAKIDNDQATATVVLQGSHVLAYQPHGHPPVLWVSRQSGYGLGKSIRGGIPVCWPWFAAHPTDTGKPAHGFVRTSLWTVTGSRTVDEATGIQLEMGDSAATRALWPHPFQLQLAVTVGRELAVELIVHNPGPEPFTFTGALHSYFSVSDISKVTIHGLEGGTYLDKVEDFKAKTQPGPIRISSETDRIYLDTTATCLLEDEDWQRRISIAKSGSHSTVVWNPWVEKARNMADFGDEEYREMVCIETANAAEDVVTLDAGQTHHLRAVIRSELAQP